MFSSKPNFLKLRTNLRLCINRLKLLEKKKTELALKSRVEIADFIRNGKLDRARIRVESIIREDYLVEAMEMVEMYCDTVLARFGLVEKIAELDPGIEEAVATIIWATPRLSSDVAELKEVTHQLALKYSKEFAEACRTNGLQNVNEKVISKLTLSSPPKMLVENYMVEISKTYKVPFEPDPVNMLDEEAIPSTSDLINLGADGEPIDTMPANPSSDAFVPGTSQPPNPNLGPSYPPNPNQAFDQASAKPFNYPQPNQPPYPVYPNQQFPHASPFQLSSDQFPSQPPAYTSNIPPGAGPLPPKLPMTGPNDGSRPPLTAQITWDDAELPILPEVPTFPEVPSNHDIAPPPKKNPPNNNESIDFDDLSRRFEELKKRK